MSLFGQTAPDPNPWAQLGVSGLLVVFAVWVIVWLLKMLREAQATIAAKDVEIRELGRAKDQEIRELSRGQLEIAERAIPSLNETARVVAEASDELRRRRRQ